MARKSARPSHEAARRVTLGREWRSAREQGVIITLPSGNTVRLRSVGLDLLLKIGRLPDSLTPLIAARLGISSEEKTQSDPLQQARDLLALAEAVCELAFIEPRIVADPQADDEISIEDVSFEDKMFVLSVLERPASALEPFRDKSARNVESVAAESDDGTTT